MSVRLNNKQEFSSREIYTISVAIYLFDNYGFNRVDIDLIIKKANITKSIFYKYFESKEKLIEIVIKFQVENLKMDIYTIIYNHFKNESIETIREVYFLHIKYERSYGFLFKAILEIKNKYPKAYDFVAEYRKWVLNEIYKLIVKIKENLTIVDAFLLIFIIDGQVLDRVNVDYTENAEIKLNYFFRCIELI